MHFGSPKAVAKVKHDLSSRRGRWLHKTAKAMYKATMKDWEEWRRGWKEAARTKAS